MPAPKGNQFAKNSKGGGRKGYNHEIVIRLAYDIVSRELRKKGDEEISRKDKFNAAVELVKKALPTNVDIGEKTLKLLFDKAFTK